MREDQKRCPKCGAGLTIALVEGKLCWAYQAAEIVGIQHMHENGFCYCCHEHVQVADQPPAMIEKGAADASLRSHLTTSNRGDHLPLYPYEEVKEACLSPPRRAGKGAIPLDRLKRNAPPA